MGVIFDRVKMKYMRAKEWPRGQWSGLFLQFFFFKVSLGQFQVQAGPAFATSESSVGHGKRPRPAQDPQG